MRRQTRTNLFLLLMVVLLGVAVFAEFRRENAIQRDSLTHMDPDAIRSLTVRCQSCITRRFEKVDGHWFMREPHDGAADDNRIARLASIVTAPIRYRQQKSELDETKLGLEPPVATLEVDGLVLKFGTTDAIHNDRYAEVGDTIALVPDRFSALLFSTPESELASPPKP
jgi:hypothetical protein